MLKIDIKRGIFSVPLYLILQEKMRQQDKGEGRGMHISAALLVGVTLLIQICKVRTLPCQQRVWERAMHYGLVGKDFGENKITSKKIA